MSLKTYRAIGSASRMWCDTAYDKFIDSWTDMLLYSQRFLCGPNEYIHRLSAPVSWHSSSRNHLVEHMRGDWLYMADTDHAFTPDILERLLLIMESEKIDVVSGLYLSKHPPHSPVMGIWKPEGGVMPILDWRRDARIFPVGVVGAGCLLVRRSVFTRICTEFRCQPFDIIPGYSEDYSFCVRCQKLGIPVYVAPQVQCHHVIKTVLDADDYIPPAGATVIQAGLDGVWKQEAASDGH